MADEAQLKVRLLRSLKAKVDAAAHENRRTLNAEIVARLERTFVEDAERAKGLAFVQTAKSGPAVTDQEERFAQIEDRLGKLEDALGLAEDVETESPSKMLLAQGRGKRD